KREAQDHLDEMTTDARTGKYTDPKAGRVTVRVYAERWAAAQDWEPSTRERVEGTLRKHVYPAFGDRQIGSVVPTELRGCATKVGQTMAASTARNVWFVVTDLFAAAVADGVRPVDPCAGIRPPEKVQAEISIPSQDEVARLIDATPERY